jgi:hypothetical protein
VYMLVVSKINPDLYNIISTFSDFFFNRDISHLEPLIGSNAKMKKVSIKEMAEEATSEEYLQKAIAANPLDYGFPRHSWGLELVQDKSFIEDSELIDVSQKVNDKLMNFFGARFNALQMYYPAGGYIGWHTNCNAKGYNIVMSCNPGADGYFVHYDHNEKKYNYFYDKAGWNIKAGYFGSDLEPEKMYWHAAKTNTPRVTLSYIIDNKNMWMDMMDDIEMDKEFISEDL